LHCRKLAASSAAINSSAGGGSGRLTRGLAGAQSRPSFPTARDLGISIDDPNDDFAVNVAGESPLRQPQEAESPAVARSMGATGKSVAEAVAVVCSAATSLPPAPREVHCYAKCNTKAATVDCSVLLHFISSTSGSNAVTVQRSSIYQLTGSHLLRRCVILSISPLCTYAVYTVKRRLSSSQAGVIQSHSDLAPEVRNNNSGLYTAAAAQSNMRRSNLGLASASNDGYSDDADAVGQSYSHGNSSELSPPVYRGLQQQRDSSYTAAAGVSTSGYGTHRCTQDEVRALLTVRMYAVAALIYKLTVLLVGLNID
jgi:hypothetical protein